MDLLFENITKFSKEVYEKYSEFHINKFGVKTLVSMIAISIFILFGFIVNLIYHNYFTCLFFVLGAIFFFIWKFLRPSFMVDKELKSDKLTKQKEITSRFYENKFIVYNDTDCYELTYRNLYKVFKSEEFFYLYLNKNYAFLIDKSGFTVGNAEDFDRFIRKKCWLTYKK